MIKGKSIIVALTLILSLLFTVQVLALAPMDNFYVNDYVGVLNETDTQEMVERANRLCTENGVQVVAVIVDNYVGSSIDSYATKLFNEWGIGQEEDNNGILLVVAVGDRDVCIRVGDGLEGQLPDSKTGRILDDYFIPYAKINDFDSAVYNTYVKLLAEGSRLDTSGKIVQGHSKVIFYVVLSLIAILILIFVRRRRVYIRNHYSRYPMRRNGGHVHNHIPTTPHNRTHGGMGRTSGGGASRSFGSSSGRSSSSSGRSRSSGGRSSGGGGRSSGGGSSRKF